MSYLDYRRRSWATSRTPWIWTRDSHFQRWAPGGGRRWFPLPEPQHLGGSRSTRTPIATTIFPVTQMNKRPQLCGALAKPKANSLLLPACSKWDRSASTARCACLGRRWRTFLRPGAPPVPPATYCDQTRSGTRISQKWFLSALQLWNEHQERLGTDFW